jgi:hypothetical protein
MPDGNCHRWFRDLAPRCDRPSRLG